MAHSTADDGAVAGPDAGNERAGTERLVFFTDAVLAIALTLLAIELPLPAQGSNAAMLHAAGEAWPEYLAFLISFAVIGAHWRLHHQVFHDVQRVTPKLIRLNQNWLLVAVVTPFLTRLLSEGDINAVRFLPYAVAQTVQFALLAAMIAIVRRADLTGDPASAAELAPVSSRALVFSATFAASVPVFLLAGQAAFVVWAVVPLAARAIRGLRARRRVAGQHRALPPDRPDH
jgi:uncharacterized membrane protein